MRTRKDRKKAARICENHGKGPHKLFLAHHVQDVVNWVKSCVPCNQRKPLPRKVPARGLTGSFTHRRHGFQQRQQQWVGTKDCVTVVYVGSGFSKDRGGESGNGQGGARGVGEGGLSWNGRNIMFWFYETAVLQFGLGLLGWCYRHFQLEQRTRIKVITEPAVQQKNMKTFSELIGSVKRCKEESSHHARKKSRRFFSPTTMQWIFHLALWSEDHHQMSTEDRGREVAPELFYLKAVCLTKNSRESNRCFFSWPKNKRCLLEKSWF